MIVLDNKVTGYNIYLFRNARGKKASDMAPQLGMKEAAYSKHERGETALTLEFVQKVAEILRVNPLRLLTADPDNFIESMQRTNIPLND